MKIKKSALQIIFKIYSKAPYLIVFLFITATVYSLQNMPSIIKSKQVAISGSHIITPDAVMQANLFGILSQENVAQDSGFANEISSLHLKGIFFSADKEQAMAIIYTGDSAEKTYKRRDVLFADISLAELFPDKIVLQRNNKTETIYLIPPRS